MPDAPTTPDRVSYVRRMFGAVARRYDLLNHLLSAGLDRRWRVHAARAVFAASSRERELAVTLERSESLVTQGMPATLRSRLDSPRLVVDVCTGTGDLALAVLARSADVRVIGCDFCRPMLERAREKFARRRLTGRTALIEADALALPLADGVADAATCAFGLRNTDSPARCLAEMVRVVRPGGRVVVLEFHSPRGLGPLGRPFALYFRRILPRLGAWISGGGHGGYAYLVESIEAFGPPEKTAERLRDAGLADVTVEPLTGGIASVFAGTKP